MKTTSDPFPALDQVVHRLKDVLNSGMPDRIAIHAGHFMLISRENKVVPSVAANTDDGMISNVAENSLREALNRFSTSTWRLGATLTARLRAAGNDVGLLTLVNDWQYLGKRVVPNGKAMRDVFFDTQRVPFPIYEAILLENGLDDRAVIRLSDWWPFISESWLRRRIEKRLKRMRKSDSPNAPRLSIERTVEGKPRLVFDDFGRACQILVCGQSDCAGEVMELICLLHEQGYRQLVNIVPSECEIPVNEGSRRAIAVFGLKNFTAVNVSVPCLAAAQRGLIIFQEIRASRVSGTVVDGGQVDAVIERIELEGAGATTKS